MLKLLHRTTMDYLGIIIVLIQLMIFCVNGFVDTQSTSNVEKTSWIHGQQKKEQSPALEQKQALPERHRLRHRRIKAPRIHTVLSSGTMRDSAIKPYQHPMEKMLQDLQEQFTQSEATQVRTRSLVFELQEKQARQEESIQFLKNQLSEVTAQQKEHSQMLSELKDNFDDMSWGIQDVKVDQLQMKDDIKHLKEVQEFYNTTVTLLENHIIYDSDDHVTNVEETLHQLGTDIGDIKSTLSKQRRDLIKFKKEVKLKLMKKSVPDYERTTVPVKQTKNEIPILPGSDDTVEGSGERGTDNILSKVEEKDNQFHTGRFTKGHDSTFPSFSPSPTVDSITSPETRDGSEPLTTSFPSEETTKEEKPLPNRNYEQDLVNLYGLFLNLSIQVTQLEKQLLTKQQEQFNREIQELQSAFIKFTHQILSIKEWQLSTQTQLNTTFQNKKDITHVHQFIENHAARLKAIEQSMDAHQTIDTLKISKIDDELSVLTRKISQINTHSKEHRHNAFGNFEQISHKLSEHDGKLNELVGRLVFVEVRVLNSSFQQCQKQNNDLMQDAKLGSLEQVLQSAKSRVSVHDSMIKRLNKGLSQVYGAVKQKGVVLDELINQNAVLPSIMGQTTALKHEVTKFINQLPQSCDEVYASGQHISKTYLIKSAFTPGSALLYCDMAEEGPWTVIQRRLDESIHFARTWAAYKLGFGDVSKSFWIGNALLHNMTSQQNYTLKIEMWDVLGRYWTAEYEMFSLGDELSKYTLHLGGYSGNATNSLAYSNEMAFSTMDQDNDLSSTHCAKFYTSGWWYKHCHYSNLNGRYNVGIVWFNKELDEWIQMKKSVMKIKPVMT